MLLNTAISQGDVILQGLVYYGIPSLIGGFFWLIYTTKRSSERLDVVEKTTEKHEDRLDNVEEMQSKHDKNLELSVQRLTSSIEALNKGFEDLPDKIVAKLYKDGMLTVKN